MINFVPFEISIIEMNQMVSRDFGLCSNFYLPKLAASLFKYLYVFIVQIMCHALERAKLF